MTNLSKTIAILGVVAGLGVTALPLSSYAAPVKVIDGAAPTEGAEPGATYDDNQDSSVEANATVKLTIKKKLSLALDTNEADLGDGSATPAIAATVITNNTKGYDLKIAGSTTTGSVKTVLTSGVVADDIVASAGTAAAPIALAKTTSSVWGYTVTGDDIAAGFKGEGVGKYAGVTDGGETIASNTAATAATGNVTTIKFGAALIENQAAGTYNGQVTFTASDK